MNSTISILHISDLHRSKGTEISNSSLLSSLISDKDKYTISENRKIKPPDLIVVSGDIIRGASKPDGAELEVSHQYDEALVFLNDLTRYFLNGNKDRIVLIPGNHDVDWKYSRESMQKIELENVVDEKQNLKWEYLKESINQNSLIRWSWKDLSFYRITDVQKYNKRLEAFSLFYSKFYDNKRHFSLNPNEQFDIFDNPDINLTIISFNSCCHNDHLRLVGDIHPECIAEVNLKLREYKRRGRLIIGTWHHNTKGQPYDSNYMDSSSLKNFIDSGIAIGLHGHQHKTELIHEYSNVIEQKRIIVFSAGTLCGGPAELPAGNNRQYNLIEIDSPTGEDVISVTLHVREKTDTSAFENPIWTAGRIDSQNISHYTVGIPKPKIEDISLYFIEIEKLMNAKEYEQAKASLLKLDTNDDLVRKFLIECTLQTEDYNLAVTIFAQPRTSEEAIVLLNASIQMANKKEMKRHSETIKPLYSSDPSVDKLIKKIEAITK